MQATCPTQLVLPYLITLIVYGEVHKLWSSSLCIFLKPPITSSIASTNYEVTHYASSSSHQLLLLLQVQIMKWLIMHLPPALHYSYIVSINILLHTCPHTSHLCCSHYSQTPSYSPISMIGHMVTHGKGSEGEPGEWSGYPVSLKCLWNTAYPAQ